ncbi:hypothetical protein SEMRO_460_G147490.1 [Seminavis robusta]|uniref:Uncharacterized protein n=1 Tax=Seminavis robusta TaxID=568900 RepID=A0A9N8DY48_9STRA|nr:hypothetical protein SEMRO_460_G147490.1 [Seminavis robusta]|eukprot:Sro460_g147490.1 n/a (129) ;mRNA; f:30344-30730
MFYETCSALDEGTEPKRKKQKTKSNNTQMHPQGPKPAGCSDDNYCKACGNWGHKRRTSRLCPKNRKLCDSHPSVSALEGMTDDQVKETQQSLLDSIPLEMEETEAHNRTLIVENILEDNDNDEDDIMN